MVRKHSTKKTSQQKDNLSKDQSSVANYPDVRIMCGMVQVLLKNLDFQGKHYRNERHTNIVLDIINVTTATNCLEYKHSASIINLSYWQISVSEVFIMMQHSKLINWMADGE